MAECALLESALSRCTVALLGRSATVLTPLASPSGLQTQLLLNIHRRMRRATGQVFEKLPESARAAVRIESRPTRSSNAQLVSELLSGAT